MGAAAGAYHGDAAPAPCSNRWASSSQTDPLTSQNFDFLSITSILKANLKLFLLILEGFEVQLPKNQNASAPCAAGALGGLCRAFWPV